MVIIMMLASAPPIAGFAARKSLAITQGALPKARMGQGGAQQQGKRHAGHKKKLAHRTHKKAFTRVIAD